MVRLNCYRKAGIVERQITQAFTYVSKELNINLSKLITKESLLVRTSDLHNVGLMYDKYENVMFFIYLIAIIKSDMGQRNLNFEHYYKTYNLQCIYDTLACINVNYREILRIFELETFKETINCK
jgi:hypothetical protein